MKSTNVNEVTNDSMNMQELTADDLTGLAGGYTKQKPDGTAAGNVAAKWNVAQGAVA